MPVISEENEMKSLVSVSPFELRNSAGTQPRNIFEMKNNGHDHV